MEPYPKSLAPELYLDSIDVDPGGGYIGQVKFEPFVGVAPRMYMALFAMNKRKDDEGNVLTWSKSTAQPRFESFAPSYLRNEKDELDDLYEKMRQEELTLLPGVQT